MSVVAIDWSGAKKPARKIWLAEAKSGQIDRLEPLSSRDAAFEEMVSSARVHPDAVVGLDFAFSLPGWFLRQRRLASAFDLWSVVEREGERWLSACEPPFWGRLGSVKPKLESHYRRTEERLLVGGHKPKSGFQINGAGTVGTGSIRGMPFLAKARRAGFSVWPFDMPRTPMIVEIYPRALTGAVVKSSPSTRAEYLLDRWPGLHPSMHNLAIGSDDAFDAAVSALVMDDHRDEFARLRGTDKLGMLEGEIWLPLVRPNNALHPSVAARRALEKESEAMKNGEDEVNWSAVTARCLAYLCLKNSRYADKSILEQAQFLEKLGLPLEDRAGVVGSTPASLRELSRQAKAKKGTGKNAKAKRR